MDIQAGDGAALGAGILALLVACVVLPWAFVAAWGLVVTFVMGEASDD